MNQVYLQCLVDADNFFYYNLMIRNLFKFVWQMTTAISIEDVRREVKILKALSGHKHLVKFFDACEDANNVYIVMEYVFSCFLFHQPML